MTDTPYIFLHGAWHGSWCWVPFLEKFSQYATHVYAPDLPGRNGLKFPDNYHEYLNLVQDLVINVSNKLNRQAVLVGHSLSGLLITQLTEFIPDRIKALIYVSAFLVNDKESVNYILQRNPSPSSLHHYFSLDLTKGTLSVDKKGAQEIFYNHCDIAIANWASDNLVAEPLIPMDYNIRLKSSAIKNIPKYYISTLDDRAIPIEFQKSMLASFNSEFKVFSMNSDHFPFLSHSDEFLDNIVQMKL